MQFLTSIGLVLAIAMTILMAGILMSRTPQESLRSAFTEGLLWDMGLFFCICIEVLIFENL